MNGLDLIDDNVLAEIWSNTVRIRLDAINEVRKNGEEAGAKLKKIVEEPPK